MRYASLGILCIIVSAQTVCVAASDPQPAPVSTASATSGKGDYSAAAIRLSAQKGLTWLLDHPKSLHEVRDVLWIMHEINNKYCRNAGLDRYIHAHHTCRSNTPGFDMIFQRLLDCDTVSRYQADKFLRSKPDDIWTWMPMALYCDISPLPEKAIAGIYDIASSTGYILTHQLVAMMFMEQAGCVNRGKNADFREALWKTAKKIEQEQEHSSIEELDLYAERSALLAAAGYPELVSREWINNIIARQEASGQWGNNNPDGSAPHTTVLALWALVQHLNECPLPSGPAAGHPGYAAPEPKTRGHNR